MSKSAALLHESVDNLLSLMLQLDGMLCECINGLQVHGACGDASSSLTTTSRVTSKGNSTCASSNQEGGVVGEALQLLSFMTHVPWRQLSAAATLNQPHLVSHTRRKYYQLRAHTCVLLPLHAICVLGMAGRLTSGQRQRIITLLECVGGGKDSAPSTDTSNIHAIWEQLQEQIANAGCNLTDILWAQLANGQPDLSSQAASLSGHLLSAFGKHQLPLVPACTRNIDCTNNVDHAALRSDVQSEKGTLTGLGVMDVYLSWMQDQLLRVINEVLS
jgi:hypothetical protein